MWPPPPLLPCILICDTVDRCAMGFPPNSERMPNWQAKHRGQKKKHTLALCLPTWHSHGPWRKIPLASRVDLWSYPVWYIVNTSCSCAVLLACLCIAVTFWWPFFLNSNQVMLSFGAAPASSCGRGNSSALPDYLPEEDDSVVISDKVSKRHGKFNIWTQSLSNLSSNFL